VLTHGSLFTGIAGFDLGFERCGMVTKWQVEIDPKLRARLAVRFPGAKQYADIRECGAHNLKRVDVISGGFPCQPFSQAGRRAGKDDNRYLWPEMLRVISALRPTFVVAENVSGLLSLEDGRVLDEVYASLEAAAYETIPPLVIPACAVGARHRRDRVWIVAHSRSERRQQESASSSRNEGANEGRGAEANHKPKRDGEGRTSSDSVRQGLPQRAIESGIRCRANEPSAWEATSLHGGHSSIEGFPDWAGGEVGQPSPLTEFERPGGREVERHIRRVAYGLPGSLDGALDDEESSDSQAGAKGISDAAAMREMRKHGKRTATSPGSCTTATGEILVPAVPHIRGCGCRKVGQGQEETEELRGVWDGVCPEPLQETQDLQCGMPVGYREIECVKEVAARVDRLKSLGNAIVPQIAEWIGRRIVEVHRGGTN
jgi:site-specific DNA-cytosine methylase